MADKTTSASSARSSFHRALGVSNIKNHIPIMLGMENVKYTMWAELFKIHSKSHRVIDHIIPSEKTGSLTTDEDKELWLTLDATVLQWIYCTISSDLLPKVFKLDASAKEVWNGLRDMFKDNENSLETTAYVSSACSTFHPALAVSNIKNHIPIMLGMEKVKYTMWAELFKIHAKSHRVIDHIIPSEKTTEEDKELWLMLDATVLRWIYCSISSDLLNRIFKQDTSAKEAWNELRVIFQDNETTDTAKYIPLDRAIMSGNWEKAEEIFNKDENVLTAGIDIDGNTPLHIAVGTRNLEFVKKLLDKLTEIKPVVLLSTIRNKSQRSALHSAALAGNMEAAKMLVKRDPHLLFSSTSDKDGHLPIHKAIVNFHIKTFKYLLQESKEKHDLCKEDGYTSPFHGVQGVVLLTNVIHAGELDDAYDLIKDFPDMATTKDSISSPLSSIAGKADAYLSGTRHNFYQRFLYSHIPIKKRGDDVDTTNDIENQETQCRRSYLSSAIQKISAKFWELAVHVPHIKKIRQEREKHNAAILLLECICKGVGKLKSKDIFEHYSDGFNFAVVNNTFEAIEVIIRHFPQATWTGCKDYLLSQNAIINRCEKVYDFSVEYVVNNHLLRTCIDKDGNNLLHLAGKLAPIHKLNEVTGAALQMQRELQWFEEVIKFVLPGDKEQKNKLLFTPMMMFRKTHTQLRKEGEEWMKKAADSYTITAALIITVAFAAAITVPGGNNSDTGKAIFETKSSFIVFVVSDAISLFTSATSLLMFLSVLTARYRDEDFLSSLPKRLILGLVMLFLSMTSMIVAFSATLYLLFGQGKAWILIPIGALTCLPIASFMTLQFPLLAELIQSTYGHGIFSKKSKGTFDWEY